MEELEVWGEAKKRGLLSSAALARRAIIRQKRGIQRRETEEGKCRGNQGTMLSEIEIRGGL